MIGPVPPEWFVSDGCTFAPDEIHGIDLRVACRYHDWAVSEHTSIKRWRADTYFYCNLRALGTSRWTALIYFVGVRFGDTWIGGLFGWRHDK